jgi:Tol biopolymer transport system component
MKFRVILVLLLTTACGASPTPEPKRAPASGTSPRGPLPSRVMPEAAETHLGVLQQLTFEGENAEAYWSGDGRSLSLQAKLPGHDCDRIYRMNVASGSAERVPVSNGAGATTCAHYLPGDREILYASTHLGGAACPPKPDHGKGYVWPLHPAYDIFKVGVDGENLVRLTETPGYDAEGTVCRKDGTILFTSVRDGDLELYRMDRDGKNVVRLTNAPGYDGGAFFNADCTRIVWRASRPKAGQELDSYKALLAENLVRPSKLEIYVANADGSEPVQVTYLDAASFAPFFHPSGKRILFSSNYGDPKGREFDLWAVDDNGARLERITHAAGFDGFPMFSPDGKTLAFSSNRRTQPGSHDTHVFLAAWHEGSVTTTVQTAADRVIADVAYLADPKREGRGLGQTGLATAGEYIERRFQSLGVRPAGDGETFRQTFSVSTALALAPASRVVLDDRPLDAKDFAPLAFSPARSDVAAPLVLAGYGIVDTAKKRDDYRGVAARGKVVVVRRFVPDSADFEKTEDKRRFGDLRYKVWLAKERGARGVIVVDDPLPPSGAAPDWKPPPEAALPALRPEGYGDAGIPVLMVKRDVLRPVLDKLAKKQPVKVELKVELTSVQVSAFNVVGKIPAGVDEKKRLPGTIVIGAHYDHLGLGGRHSLAPDRHEPHVGADDNASGVAGVLEIARLLSARRAELERDVLVIGFSGEESGLLGSSHFVKAAEAGKVPALPPKGTFAMLNLDMIGRLRENKLVVLGGETAAEWPELLKGPCALARVECSVTLDGGYGPSDQMSFFLASVPVLHFFTGAHSDYHKPSDTTDKVNAAGAGQIAALVSELALSIGRLPKALTFNPGAKSQPPGGDLRSFNASLGTIPDYAGPGPGKSGVLIGGVRPGGAAERAGMRRGDLLVRLGRHEIASIEDFMFVLNASKPGETTKATVVRNGKKIELDVTFQESAGRRK